MFLTSIPVSSGPWRFDSWQKGVQLAVAKNAKFTAGPKLKLDRVVFRYILDTNARFQALKAGEGQVMEPQPQLQIADFLKDKKFVVDQKIGYAWEHVDIQFGPQGHLALKQPYIRKALITGINKKQIAGALYATIAPGLPALYSHMFEPFESTTSRTGLSTSSTSRPSSTSCRRRVAPVGRASLPRTTSRSSAARTSASCRSASAPRPVTSSARSPSRSCRGSSRASESSSSPLPGRRHVVRHHASFRPLGPGHVHVGRQPVDSDHDQGPVRLWW